MSCLGFLRLAILFLVLPTLRAEKIDNRDFAIDTCYPAPNEIRLAEERARNYWARYAARFGSNPVYLAVEASKIFPAEVQNLWPKLINSESDLAIGVDADHEEVFGLYGASLTP